MPRLRIALVGLAVGALALTGCSAKQVDVAATGAVLVPGTSNLWTFCHNGRAIYFTNYGSTANDEFEFLIYDAEECVSTAPEGSTPEAPSVQNLPEDE